MVVDFDNGKLVGYLLNIQQQKGHIQIKISKARVSLNERGHRGGTTWAIVSTYIKQNSGEMSEASELQGLRSLKVAGENFQGCGQIRTQLSIHRTISHW